MSRGIIEPRLELIRMMGAWHHNRERLLSIDRQILAEAEARTIPDRPKKLGINEPMDPPVVLITD